MICFSFCFIFMITEVYVAFNYNTFVSFLLQFDSQQLIALLNTWKILIIIHPPFMDTKMLLTRINHKQLFSP